ncbi:hypothetical protein M5X00_18460 [Paenibacillus alvei]|uniref:hypothetical protein n=1 Tax=Paenibacillus alvei TaxID=44250 RepID=UPI0002880B3F|nr:hypothetical protein [Paenibacillus alvei]EJW16878.1 hypothetical protein PAV_5c04610 [Paenibacillus alvei DSM 29]MCY9540776.1 hypothetical protein [Paenibacillus alvei]MCY9705203.1 hypothetical protein [Paenibacillus alvei]MCY9733750.1 hypothetical protein [Paenibacillus alvei]MCY9756226.1 hypothetical protein [Paenibacillus alvei]
MMQATEELANKMLELSGGNREALMSYVLGMLEGSIMAVDKLDTSIEEILPNMKKILSAYHKAHETLRDVDTSKLN